MIIFDAEADNLLDKATKIWCVVFKNTENGQYKKFTPENLQELPAFMDKCPQLCGHNCIAYDFPLLEKILGYKYKGDKHDTLIMSRVLFPDKEGHNPHSVETYGESIGIAKVKNEDWSQFTPHMLERCTTDVDIQAEIYKKIMSHIDNLSISDSRIQNNKMMEVFRFEEKVCEIIEQQAANGFAFDLPKAYGLIDRLNKEIRDIEEELMPQMPVRVIKMADKETKAFKKDGTMTTNADNWFVKNFSNRPVSMLGTIEGDFSKVGFELFNLSSSTQLKDYLLSKGWTPKEYNFKKDKWGKPERDNKGKLINTTPKTPKTIEDWEEVAEQLNDPKIKLLAMYNKANHRLHQIEGFVRNLRSDHRIEAQANTCGTNCVIAGTLIQTDTGNIPIEKVQKGDLILTHKGRYKPCTEFIVNGIKPVFRVRLNNGMEVTCTENHPFWTGESFILTKDLVIGQNVKVIAGIKEWKKYPHGDYFISNYGDIVNSKIGYVLNQNDLSKKRRLPLYKRGVVDLIINGVKVKKNIGNVVAETFISLIPEGMECCHIDGNPTNNYITNLKWGTSEENSSDQKLHGRHIKSVRVSKNSKLTQQDVDLIRFEYENNYKKGLYQELADKLGCSRRNISAICKGKRWQRRVGEDSYEFRYDFMESTVVSIEALGEQPTFDITVQEDHSYVGNGIVLHNTARMQHRIVVNVPKADPKIYYGTEMRSLFIAAPGKILVGVDACALEARIEAHYIHPFDPNGVWELLNGDIHAKNAQIFDCTRNVAKGGKYALTYGCSKSKLATTIGKPSRDAERLYDAFWEGNPGLKQLKERVEKAYDEHGYLLAIDGRPLSIRYKHALINTLFQSAGSIVMKRALVMAKESLDCHVGDNYKFVGNFHDEMQIECEKSEADLIGSVVCECIKQAGIYYKLNVEMAGNYQVGRSWAETH